MGWDNEGRSMRILYERLDSELLGWGESTFAESLVTAPVLYFFNWLVNGDSSRESNYRFNWQVDFTVENIRYH